MDEAELRAAIEMSLLETLSKNPTADAAAALSTVARAIDDASGFYPGDHIEVVEAIPGPHRSVAISLRALTPFGAEIIERMRG